MDNLFPNVPVEKHSHFTAVLGIFVLIVLGFLAYVVYLFVKTPTLITTATPQTIPLIEQRVTLTPEQSQAKQKILAEADTSQVKLTPKQAQQKQLLIKQAQQKKN